VENEVLGISALSRILDAMMEGTGTASLEASLSITLFDH
jgi:hypothetical protein